MNSTVFRNLYMYFHVTFTVKSSLYTLNQWNIKSSAEHISILITLAILTAVKHHQQIIKGVTSWPTDTVYLQGNTVTSLYLLKYLAFTQVV